MIIHLRYFLDLSSYWSQMVLTLALAIERYIIIVRAHDSAILLSKRRRVLFYSLTIFTCCLIPLLGTIDNLINLDTGQWRERKFLWRGGVGRGGGWQFFKKKNQKILPLIFVQFANLIFQALPKRLKDWIFFQKLIALQAGADLGFSREGGGFSKKLRNFFDLFFRSFF